MPFYSENPIVRVESGAMHTIETRNAENLFGLWSVFSKCSAAMEDGKRYENMSWRLWSRETFCCAPDHANPTPFCPQWTFTAKLSGDLEAPELSSSVESGCSDVEPSQLHSSTRSDSSSTRPELRRHDSAESRSRGKEKHITPIDLEKMVNSIKEKKELEPLSPLPPQLAQALPTNAVRSCEDTTPRPSSPPHSHAHIVPESSTSTVATAMGSEFSNMSPPVGSETSTSTDLSSHSIVRGFSRGQISSSMRSSTNLVTQPSILKPSTPQKFEPLKKKAAPMFVLGGSSDEDNNSSFESSFLQKRSSLSDALKRPAFNRKTTTFKEEVITRTIQDRSEESEAAIETDSEDDDEDDESDDNAIEDEDYEDDDDQWEDDDNSGPSSVTDKELFRRVDSSANLRSRRSLLTTLMHEGDRAKALQNAASQSTPALRRSRTSSPNGPSLATSPHEEPGLMMRASQIPRSKPIIMTTSNTHPPALSPRTTRRNMLQTELTESLRKHLLWERQQKNATNNAVLKRQQSAISNPALRRAMTTNDIKSMKAFPGEATGKPSAYRDMAKNNSSYNEYFDQGLQEYHQKGW
ncbi:DUF1752-domain-containing protein [Lophium mytilinum]|uniref:DUF1752-domain-containing protein n=1 Tax=Lophium mytilinum TaxID=390894 RepID=A0A6A6QUS4_9PEZI|nr:DUF1752-domain-containing protein [Lophium mytilinum]